MGYSAPGRFEGAGLSQLVEKPNTLSQRRPGSPHSKKQTPLPPNGPDDSAFNLTGSAPLSHFGRDLAVTGKLDTRRGHTACPTGFAGAHDFESCREHLSRSEGQVHPIARSKLPCRPTVQTIQLSTSPEVPLYPILGATLLLRGNSTPGKVTLLARQALQEHDHATLLLRGNSTPGKVTLLARQALQEHDLESCREGSKHDGLFSPRSLRRSRTFTACGKTQHPQPAKTRFTP